VTSSLLIGPPLAFAVEVLRDEVPFDSVAEHLLGNIVNWDFVAQNLDGNGERRADQEG